MIIHELILQHLRHRDDGGFYLLQAKDAIGWIEKKGGLSLKGQSVLDLGCGHGIFGAELAKAGAAVTFADEQNFLSENLTGSPFIQVNLDTEQIEKVGRYDLVVVSNVLEHLSKPKEFLASAHKILKPNGHLYLSWTNWLSPWGGHEFSPFHYFGPKLGPKLFDKITGKKRFHTPFVNLFPTYIGEILRFIRNETDLEIVVSAPRYYPELSGLVKIPIVREFLTWNCALLLKSSSIPKK